MRRGSGWTKSVCPSGCASRKTPCHYETNHAPWISEEAGPEATSEALLSVLCTLNFALMTVCAFCNRNVPTRGHHVVPRCKGGSYVAPTCCSCEDFIHKTWSHNELRDTFNTVEKIIADARFQKFLRWL